MLTSTSVSLVIGSEKLFILFTNINEFPYLNYHNIFIPSITTASCVEIMLLMLSVAYWSNTSLDPNLDVFGPDDVLEQLKA